MTELDCMDLSEGKHAATAALITQRRQTGISSRTAREATRAKEKRLRSNHENTHFFIWGKSISLTDFSYMNPQKGTFYNFNKASVRQCLVVLPFCPPPHTTFCLSSFVIPFKIHAETSSPGRAVGRSGQAAAWTCPSSSSAAWGASREAAAEGWEVRAASRHTKTSSSPSLKPGAARWTPPRTSLEQAWSWSEERSSIPSLGSSQGLQVPCPCLRNHRLNGHPASSAPIEFPFAAMVFNPHARQVQTCWEHWRGLWAVHSPAHWRLKQKSFCSCGACPFSWLTTRAHSQPCNLWEEGRGWVRDAFITGCFPCTGEKASHWRSNLSCRFLYKNWR